MSKEALAKSYSAQSATPDSGASSARTRRARSAVSTSPPKRRRRLRAGDAGRLSTLGVDQRMSKAFMLGGAARRGEASRVASTRPREREQESATRGQPKRPDATGRGRIDAVAHSTCDIV